MLTAKGEEVDRVLGLELGADDYIVKPFSPKEVVARVRAVLRRARPLTEGAALVIGQLVIDVARHTVRVDGGPVPLTPKEFDLLRTLAEARGRVLSRELLLDRVWGYTAAEEIESRTVDVHVRRLRMKLGGEGRRIVTVKGVGLSTGCGGADARAAPGDPAPHRAQAHAHLGRIRRRLVAGRRGSTSITRSTQFASESLDGPAGVHRRRPSGRGARCARARGRSGSAQAFVTRVARPTGARVTLIATDGRVVGESERSASDLDFVDNHGDRPEVRAALGGKLGRDLRQSGTLRAPLLYVALPVQADGHVIGVLRLALPLVGRHHVVRHPPSGDAGRRRGRAGGGPRHRPLRGRSRHAAGGRDAIHRAPDEPGQLPGPRPDRSTDEIGTLGPLAQRPGGAPPGEDRGRRAGAGQGHRHSGRHGGRA